MEHKKTEIIKNCLCNRIFYSIPVKLVTPVSASSGSEDFTDHDVIYVERIIKKENTEEVVKDAIIPGSSVAGAVRDFIFTVDRNSYLFGDVYKEKDETRSRMSRIYFSDLVLKDVHISQRDGISLEDKITLNTGKFDYEIVETGASGEIRIEVSLYESDTLKIENVDDMIKQIALGINTGELRFGYRKNRGLGKMEISGSVKRRAFDFKNKADKSPDSDSKHKKNDEYIRFCESIYNGGNYDSELEVPDSIGIVYSDTAKIELNLTLEGGISIRTYSAKKNEPDNLHLTLSDSTPVIPGSSWNGAIRARTFDILNTILDELNIEDKKFFTDGLNEFWGKRGKNDFQASKIIFLESELEHSTPVRMTRNKINRFDASTCDGALYNELSYFGGTTKLEILINDYKDYLWCIWLVKLSLDDLRNGILSVGGQTAVGRGIFHSEKENKYININIEDARKALVKMVRGEA